MDFNNTNMSENFMEYDYDFENSSDSRSNNDEINDEIDYLHSDVCLHTDGIRKARKTARKRAREILKGRKRVIIGPQWDDEEWKEGAWSTCETCDAILDPKLVYIYTTSPSEDEECIICLDHLVPKLSEAKDCKDHQIHEMCREANIRPCKVCNENSDSNQCHVCDTELVPKVIVTCKGYHHYHATCLMQVMNRYQQCGTCERSLCFCQQNIFHPWAVDDVCHPDYVDYWIYDEIGV